MKTPIDIHSCNFACQRPACVHRQRDELWGYVSEIYDAVLQANPKHRMTLSEVMAYAAEQVTAKQRVADAIEKMPFGDTATSFAQFVREFK